jgi:nucleotide-binding universal stress UspA family protein
MGARVVDEMPGTSELRIVVGHDLTPGSYRALDLLERQAWPPGTRIRIVTSPTTIGQQPSSFAGPRRWREHSRRVHGTIEEAHAAAAESLGRLVELETKVANEAPGAALIAEARAFDANLLVVGSHGHDLISATLVGSVSAEVARNAACSVLVVKVESDERQLLATDGSATAASAARLMTRLPLFHAGPVRVIAAASARPSYSDQAIDASASLSEPGLDAAGLDARDHAEAIASELRAVGREVAIDVRGDDAATAIIAAAREWPADVVVVGARGTSTLRRLLLGSVAQSVLNGVQSSVLIAREP